MNRRDFLKTVAATAVIAVIPRRAEADPSFQVVEYQGGPTFYLEYSNEHWNFEARPISQTERDRRVSTKRIHELLVRSYAKSNRARLTPSLLREFRRKSA